MPEVIGGVRGLCYQRRLVRRAVFGRAFVDGAGRSGDAHRRQLRRFDAAADVGDRGE